MTGCGWANPFDDNIPYKTRFEDGLVFFEDEKYPKAAQQFDIIVDRGSHTDLGDDALFFLAEYGHIILMSVLTAILFLGGWLSMVPGLPDSSFWLALKSVLVMFIFIWVRASFPRARYDQLMALLWKSYLPLSLGFVILVASIIYVFVI